MAFTLLEADEEADQSVYGAYLRAQTEADLLDIARHLDPDRYPARADAVAREMGRRGLLHTPAYTPAEGAIRYAALAAFALSAVLLTLAALLTPDDALLPSWPTGEMLPDGMPLDAILRIFTVAILRGVVVWCAHLGVPAFLLLALAGWTLPRVRAVLRRRARADVWRLTLGALVTLSLSLALAAGPRSAVPLLFGLPPSAPPGPSLRPLLDPFSSYQTAP